LKPIVLTYVKYRTEFTNLAEQLARWAKDKNLNGATLACIRPSTNCVDCHKVVGDNGILDLKRREPRPQIGLHDSGSANVLVSRLPD
jgi:hypothetical protein